MHNAGDLSDPDGVAARPADGAHAETSISVAEAEGEVARAEARARAARERAKRLRRAAGTAPGDQRDTTEIADANDDDVAVPQTVEQGTAKSSRSRLRWLRPPGRKAIAVGVGIVVACASLFATGYMVRQQRSFAHEQQLAPQFATAARQGVATLMSIDAHHTKEYFQHITDISTGDLKKQLEVSAGLFQQQAEDAKVSSNVTVEAVAVESVTKDSAVVLIAAKSDVTNPDNTKRPPASWRLAVKVDRDGGQLKISRIDFLR